ncbi:hypothetical protein ACOTHJ_13280 [Achromobacter xylosoxidans]
MKSKNTPLDHFRASLDADAARAISASRSRWIKVIALCGAALSLINMACVTLLPASAPGQHYLMVIMLVYAVGGVFCVGIVTWLAPEWHNGWGKLAEEVGRDVVFETMSKRPGVPPELIPQGRPVYYADYLALRDWVRAQCDVERRAFPA